MRWFWAPSRKVNDSTLIRLIPRKPEIDMRFPGLEI